MNSTERDGSTDSDTTSSGHPEGEDDALREAGVDRWSDLELANSNDWGSTHAGQHPDCVECELIEYNRHVHNGQHYHCRLCKKIRNLRVDFQKGKMSRFFIEQIENGCLARARRPEEVNTEECTITNRCTMM